MLKPVVAEEPAEFSWYTSQKASKYNFPSAFFAFRHFLLFLYWFSIVWYLQYTRRGRKAHIYLPFLSKLLKLKAQYIFHLEKFLYKSLTRPLQAMVFQDLSDFQFTATESSWHGEGRRSTIPPNRQLGGIRTDSKAADKGRESLGGGGGREPVCKEDQNWKCSLRFRNHLARSWRQPGFCDVNCELLTTSSNHFDQIDGRMSKYTH